LWKAHERRREPSPCFPAVAGKSTQESLFGKEIIAVTPSPTPPRTRCRHWPAESGNRFGPRPVVFYSSPHARRGAPRTSAETVRMHAGLSGRSCRRRNGRTRTVGPSCRASTRSADATAFSSVVQGVCHEVDVKSCRCKRGITSDQEEPSENDSPCTRTSTRSSGVAFAASAAMWRMQRRAAARGKQNSRKSASRSSSCSASLA